MKNFYYFINYLKKTASRFIYQNGKILEVSPTISITYNAEE